MEVIQIEKSQFEELMKKVDAMHSYLLDKPLLRDSIELLTVIEIAESLQISESTVYRAVRKGILKKNEDGKILPTNVNEALLKKQLRCELRYAEEFRKTYLYK